MRKIEVHRSSVYVWKERALAALEEALQPHKRGPKFKRLQKTPEENIRNLREGMERLKAYLKEKQRQTHLPKEKLEPQKENSRPVRCPDCGCEKVYKNGTYKRKRKGFFDKLKQDEQKEESVARLFMPLVWLELSYRKKGVSTLT